MTWQQYNTLLIPLINKFGAYHYPKDVISKAFFHWKTQSEQSLIDLINQALASNIPLELETKPKPPAHKLYIHDNSGHITDGFLDNFLAQNGVKSVVELINKKS